MYSYLTHRLSINVYFNMFMNLNSMMTYMFAVTIILFRHKRSYFCLFVANDRKQ